MAFDAREEQPREEGATRGQRPRRMEARSAQRGRGQGFPVQRPRPPPAMSAEECIRRAQQRAMREEEEPAHHAPLPAQEPPRDPLAVESPTRSLGSRWNDGAVEFESTMRLAGEIHRHEANQQVDRARERAREDQDWRANREWRERQRILEDWEYDTVTMEQIRA